jgi:vacuolar-type H+-ATPase subunit E/Vma4
MEVELEELERDIRKAKADLERAQERGNEALELKFADILSLLLKENERLDERLATGTAKMIKNNLENRSTGKTLWNLF